MKIAVDVMGFENEISHAIVACRKFLKNHTDLKIILVGDKKQIEPHFQKLNEFEIVHTDVYVSQDDTILSSRRKMNSSMQLTANLLKENQVDGVLSAGSTPIFVYIMYSTIGLLEGIKKPGFMPTFPTVDKVGFNMIDVGASIDVDVYDLVMYGIMANEFAKQRMQKPRLAVLNIGTEDHKGTVLQRKANEILKQMDDLNYIGYVEPNNLLDRASDVVLCDGYSGNIALKAMEGSIKIFSDVLKKAYKKPQNFLAALFSLPIFKTIKEQFNYKNNAGAFVLGLNKIAVKTHGSADEQQFLSSLRMLYECLDHNVLENIKTAIAKNLEKYQDLFKEMNE